MLRVIDSLSSLYQDWSQLRAQGSVKNSSVALQEFCVCGVMRLVVARAAWRCTESMGRYVSWRMFSCCSAGSKVEGDAQLADVTQGSARWRCSLQCRVCTCAHAAEPFTNERRKDLQGGAAVFNVECAHAAEPFTVYQRSLLSDRVHLCSWCTHTHTQGFTIVPLLLVERIQTAHSGAQVLGGHFSQPQSCCRLHASAMSKQHPVACIPKSRKTSCSLALLICPSILLVHIGISV